MTDSSSTAGQDSPAVTESANSSTPGWLSSLLEKAGKFQIANQYRLMADNQRVLDLTHRAEVDHRNAMANLRDQFSSSVIGEPMPVQDPDDGTQINVDSPTTNNYVTNQPRSIGPILATAVASVFGGSILSALAMWTASQIFSGDAVPVPSPDTDTQYELRLIPSKEGTSNDPSETAS